MVGTCLIRADAGEMIGAGHLVRAISLAQELISRGWRCTLCCRPDSSPIAEAVGYEGITLHMVDGDEDEEIARMEGLGSVDVVVVDHYGRGLAFEQACRRFACVVAALDDLPGRPHDCDLLLDQSAARSTSDYQSWVGPSTEILTGPRHALLRPRFLATREASLARRRSRTKVERILVFMATGSVPVIDAAVLDGLGRARLDVHYDYVIGPYGPDKSRVTTALVGGAASATVHAGSRDMARLMETADLAVGAPGASSWERCCLGLPSILLLLVNNQEGNAVGLAEAGAADILDWRQEPDSEQLADWLSRLVQDKDRRVAMGAAAAELCDGRGSSRVADSLERLVCVKREEIRHS